MCVHPIFEHRGQGRLCIFTQIYVSFVNRSVTSVHRQISNQSAILKDRTFPSSSQLPTLFSYLLSFLATIGSTFYATNIDTNSSKKNITYECVCLVCVCVLVVRAFALSVFHMLSKQICNFDYLKLTLT